MIHLISRYSVEDLQIQRVHVLFFLLCAHAGEEKRHGCHSNCVIMLVAIMKAMKTGKGRGLAQKLQRTEAWTKLSIRLRPSVTIRVFKCRLSEGHKMLKEEVNLRLQRWSWLLFASRFIRRSPRHDPWINGTRMKVGLCLFNQFEPGPGNWDQLSHIRLKGWIMTQKEPHSSVSSISHIQSKWRCGLQRICKGGHQVVNASKMEPREDVRGYVDAQVSKKDLLITCMAGCHFYTGGWAAACLQQRPVEPFIRWSNEARLGTFSLTALLGWMQLAVSS